MEKNYRKVEGFLREGRGLRKDGTAFYSIALIFVLSLSMIPSFPFMIKAYDHELGSVHKDESSHYHVRPIIRHMDGIDKDFDGVQDSLEAMISQVTANRGVVLPVVVTLYNPVASEDIDWFVMLGGRVTHVYQHVTYGFAGVIPAANISRFASLEEGNLCAIERDVPIRYHLELL